MRYFALMMLGIYVASVHIESFVLVDGLGSVSRVIGYIAFAVGLARILSRRRIVPPGLTHILLFLFVCVNYTSILWTIDPESTAERASVYTMQLAFVFLVMQLVENENELHFIEAAYVAGAVLSAVGNIVAYQHGSAAVAHSDRYAATGADPNEFALSLALAIPLAWHLSFSLRSTVFRFVFRLSPLLLITGIILTGSRGGALALVASLIVIPLCRRQVGMFTKMVIVVVVLMGITAGSGLVPVETMKRLASIGDEIRLGMMAGRGDLWAAGWAQFKDHPVVGVGAGAFPVAISVAAPTLMVAHNTYLSVLTELGCFGFSVYLAILLQLAYLILKMPKPERFIWFATLAAWAVGVSALTWEYSKPTWLLFALIIAQVRVSNAAPEAEADFSDDSPVIEGVPIAFGATR